MEKNYIEKYLDKNYDLKPSDKYNGYKYMVYDIYTHRTYNNITNFEIIFKDIIPCDNLTSILDSWYINKKHVKDKELFDFIESVNFKKGIGFLIKQIKDHFIDTEYSDEFLETRMNDYYIFTYLLPKLNRYVDKINDKFTSQEWIKRFSRQLPRQNKIVSDTIKDKILENYREKVITTKITKIVSELELTKGSKALKKEIFSKMYGDMTYFATDINKYFGVIYKEKHLDKVINDYIITLNTEMDSNIIINQCKALELEDGEQYDYFVERLNEWYGDNVDINAKVGDILSQFFITLGPTNWQVRWIGHGLLTEDKIFEAFKEHSYHKKHVMTLYNKWYDMAVMLASEKHMGNINF